MRALLHAYGQEPAKGGGGYPAVTQRDATRKHHNRYANAALLLSQLPGSQLADDESDTMLIADIPTKRWQYSRKAIGGIIGIAMALVIITIVTLAWRRCTGGKPAEQVLEINDSTTVRDSTA